MAPSVITGRLILSLSKAPAPKEERRSTITSTKYLYPSSSALNGDPESGFTSSPYSDYAEDSTPPHGMKKVRVKPKQELIINTHYRPAASPDMNLIEHVCLLIKRRIQVRLVFAGTKEAMGVAVMKEWDRLGPKDWNHLIDSIPDSIREL